MNTIGDYIRQQREQAKFSLRQLAQAAGVSNPYLSQIERGLRKPSADILQQIAERQKQVLIEIYESFRRESQPTPPTAEVISVLREPESAETTDPAEPASPTEPADDRS